MSKKDRDHVHNANGQKRTEERKLTKHMVEVTEVTHCTCGEEIGRLSHDEWRD